MDIISLSKTKEVEKRLDQAIQDGNNLSGWTEESEQLNGKITEVDTRLTSELAQNAQQVSGLEINKADKTYVDGQLNNKRDKTTSIMMADLHTEVKTSMTGGSVPVVGVDAVGEENLKIGAATGSKRTALGDTGKVIIGYGATLPNIDLTNLSMTIYPTMFIVYKNVRHQITVETIVPFANSENQVLLFDINAKTLRFLSSHLINTQLENEIILLTLSMNQSKNTVKSCYSTFDFTVTGGKIQNKTFDFGSYLFNIGNPVDFDFTNNKLVIHPGTSLYTKDKYIKINPLTNQDALEKTLTDTAKALCLVLINTDAPKEGFNLETDLLFVNIDRYPDAKIPNNFDLIGYYSVPHKKAYIKGNFTIDGFSGESSKISIDKLDFTETSRNLFDGNYVDGLLYEGAGSVLYPRFNYDIYLGKVAIVPIDPNKNYSVKVHEMDKQTHLRIGIADDYPTFTDTNTIGLAKTVFVSNDNNVQEYSFTNTATGKYVCVYVSNNGKEPKLQIEEGSTATDYINRQVISKEYIEPEKTNYDKAKYNFFINLNTLYTHDEITDYIANPNSFTIAEYHQMFNNLITNHSDMAKSTLLGQTEFGYDLYKYENTPVAYKKTNSESYGSVDTIKVDIPVPKILITAGVHGRERAGSYAAYYFFREMMENPKDDPIMDFLRRNVHLIFVPAICASGFEDNTYENRNGQNLNRDFPPYGSATQAETQLVMQVIDENNDMDFHLDFHTTSLETQLGYTLTDDRDLALTGNNMYRELGRKWQKQYPAMPQNLDYEWGFTMPANIGTMGKYSQEAHGIKSTIFEVSWINRWLAPSKNHSEYVTRLGVEVLANMIIGSLRLKTLNN